MRRNFNSFHSFFFNDTATTEIYTLSLHDALPISRSAVAARIRLARPAKSGWKAKAARSEGTRLNSSHANISYAVFCLKKKKNKYFSVDIQKKKQTSENPPIIMSKQ